MFIVDMTDLKVEINRLSKEDLEYELRVFGLTEDASVEDMRRTLRQLRRMSEGAGFELPPYPFTFAQDSEAITSKIASISAAVSAFAETRTSTAYLKLTTAIAFAVKRAQRSKPVEATEVVARSQFVSRLIALSVQLVHKARSVRKSMSVRQSTLLDLSTIGPVTSNAGEASSSSDESEIDVPTVASISRARPVPVVSWGVKFSGDIRDISVNAFLERVNELKIARQSNDFTLFNSAIDLFTGNALIWYRANRESFTNWSELSEGLRAEFLIPDYENKLFEEIKRRTQGPSETIGIYISVMKNLFSRLCVAVPEPAQLRILLRNLSPFYQSQLGLVEIDSISQLVKACKQLEARRASVEAYVPPPSRVRSLEPDLACLSAPVTPSRLESVEEVPVFPHNCWNCGQPGHRSVSCRQPRKIHCFRCGRPNVTKFSCPSCAGNARRAR